MNELFLSELFRAIPNPSYKQVSLYPCPTVALSCMYSYVYACVYACEYIPIYTHTYSHTHACTLQKSECISPQCAELSAAGGKIIAAAWRQGKNNLVAMQRLYYLILRCNIESLYMMASHFYYEFRTLYPGIGIYMIMVQNPSCRFHVCDIGTLVDGSQYIHGHQSCLQNVQKAP